MDDRVTVKVLERGLELVNAGWTQCAPARDKWLQPVPVMDERAVLFCAQGAVYRAAREVCPDRWGEAMAFALHALTEQVGVKSLPWWSDAEERTIGEVREVFRRAIIEATPLENWVTRDYQEREF